MDLPRPLLYRSFKSNQTEIYPQNSYAKFVFAKKKPKARRRDFKSLHLTKLRSSHEIPKVASPMHAPRAGACPARTPVVAPHPPPPCCLCLPTNRCEWCQRSSTIPAPATRIRPPLRRKALMPYPAHQVPHSSATHRAEQHAASSLPALAHGRQPAILPAPARRGLAGLDRTPRARNPDRPPSKSSPTRVPPLPAQSRATRS